MIFSKITQNGLTLTTDTTAIPAQYSNNIQFQFIQDTENYSGYTPSVCVALYDSSLIECADILNPGGNVAIKDGIFSIGNQILYQSGYLAVGITLTSGQENVTLPPVVYKVLPSVGGLSPLPPDTGEWQQVVDAYVNTLFETWSTENLTPIQNQLESLVSEAQQLQQTAANQQTQINNAISVMGDYQIVSEDPVQIQFKKGDGTYGDTVDLGDGLASKNMVNGDYYQSISPQYSGASSKYGIDVAQIVGAYVQDGTPTPEVPIEPQFVKISNFYTNPTQGNLTNQTSTTPVSLELRALPDGTADIWQDGKIIRNVAKVTFDGSEDENWEISSLTNTYLCNVSLPQNSKIGTSVLCDKFIYNVSSDDSEHIRLTQSAIPKIALWIDKKRLSSGDVSGLKSWLSANPITVWYVLAKPTTEPLEIPTLTSYYPFTNAWCDSAIETMITWNVLTGNVKNDQLDPAIQQYIDSNVPALITEAVNAALASYCPFIVGDIYITMNEENPNTRYPGTTWQAIEGETLVGYLEGDENFGTLGASVGEAEHTLTVDEMPSHEHNTRVAWDNTTGTSAVINNLARLLYSPANEYGLDSQPTGGGQPHNNIQPSKVVMIWQRTA